MPQATPINWHEADGACLRFHHRPGPGRTVVLVHEMGGSLESWDGVLDRLPSDMNVLRYDMRGAGLSEKLLTPCTLDQHADDLQALLDACSLHGPITVAGVAVGAAVAMGFALRQPARVERLIAMAPAWGVPPALRDATAQRGREIAEEGMRGHALALLERAYPPPLRSDAAAYARFRCRWLANDARSLGAIYQMLAALDRDAELPRLPARTVLVAGTFDPLRPPAEIDRLAALSGHAQALHVASGHFMAVNSPAWVATLIEHFGTDPAITAQSLYDDFMSRKAHRIGDAAHAA